MIDKTPFTLYHSGDRKRYSWVQLEIDNEAELYTIQITNRLDCCWGRLSNVEVRAGNDKVTGGFTDIIRSNQYCQRYAKRATAKAIVVNINCIRPISGRYVTIQIIDGSVEFMNIADVDVIGKIKSAYERIFSP